MSATRQANLQKARNRAVTKLIEQHIDEFNSYMKDEAYELGESWNPRRSDADKAADQIKKILDKHPELAALLAPAEPARSFSG